MSRTIILFYIASLISTSLFAQDFFLKTDTILSIYNNPHGIERMGDKYIIGGISGQNMFMAVYDEWGEQQHFSSRPEVDKILSFHWNNDMILQGDRILWNSVGTGALIIYEYDPIENLFSKVDTFITHPVSGEEGFTTKHVVPLDDGYLMTGFYTESFTNSDFGMYRVTSDTIIKYRIKDPVHNSFGSRIFLTEDGGFVVTSEHENCLLCGSLMIYRFDKDLKLLETMNSNEDFRRILTRDAILDSLGNVVSCSIDTYKNDAGEWRGEPLITRKNIYDKTEWDTKIGVVENDEDRDSGWWSIIEATDDDGYVVAGSAKIKNENQDFSYATLAKVSVDGDSIWYRRYSTIDSTVARHTFRDVTTTPEGGYMAVGYDRSALGPANVLLLKTNNKGLIEPDSMSQVVTLDNKVKLEVASYPNPVVEILYVQHSAAKKIYYTLSDVEGRPLYAFEAEQADETFIIDVADFANGTYFLSYRDGTGKVLGSEVVLKI